MNFISIGGWCGPKFALKELGLFKNPYQYLGHLSDAMHRAIRLVVDVAIHTKGMSREPILAWLRKKVRLQYVEECPPMLLSQYTKVFVNGYWAGVVEDPYHCVDYVKAFRRNGLLPIYMSILFDIRQNTIQIYCDEGRLTRPVFYRSETGFFFENPSSIKTKIDDNEFTWKELIAGFNEKAEDWDPMMIYELSQLYPDVGSEVNPMKLERFVKNKAVIEYIDTSEVEGLYIALKPDGITPEHTHMEIHLSLTFGMMCNLIPFPQNNPATRNSFSCGQSKQAVSLYHTNYQVRMDKSAVVLNNPQIPLVKSRYTEYINGEENCYGMNAIVAIMCYTGYNMEDAVLINEGALKRGLFRTTYYTTYETHEEKVLDASGKAESEKLFTNIENTPNIIGTKPGYEYQHLDQYGLVKEGTEVHDKMVLIGMSTLIDQKTGLRKDASKTPKKGQLGIVDKSFITEGEEGQRIAKVRVREIRIPAIGDKMASRSGQKGTIGMVIPEADMPFTANGMVPDIIVNPHALPTRMTIGQFVECITGKACALMGNFGDGTAYQASGVAQYADILTKHKYHSSGNEILYNGMTGGQLEAEIFIGPTYYMRLKHMVKDKINFRTQGPRTALTRQPVSGRANDGGLRIGEMERDGLIAHGATSMLTESMMERSDKYFMAVCNKTGLIAVYNPDKNLFLSPMADGPLKFVGSLAENNLTVQNISRHGRTFSVVRIPYSLKLLIQELQTINIAMRLITDDNIEQIENMTFSKNLNILLDKKGEVSVKEYTKDFDFTLRRQGPAPKTPVSEEEEEEDEKERQKKYGYYRVGVAPNSPEYAPSSPVWNPETPDGSPQEEGQEGLFVPTSPEYPPNSPEYPPDEESLFSAPLLSKKGGSLEGYETGSLVSLNSYRGQDNLWQIQNMGDEFITVQKYGGSSIDIQVVEAADLSQPMPVSNNRGPATQFVAGGGLPDFSLLPRQQEGTNIFLINGNNNEVDGAKIAAQAKKGGSSTEGSSSVEFSPAVTTIGGGASGVPSSVPPPPSIEKEKDSGFSIFDTMTNFLVKKL
jgi:hypothetical protein